MKNKEITVFEQAIHINKDDYFSLTDIARYKNADAPADVVKNWLRRKDTIEFIGLWELLNNSNFNAVEFDQFKNEAGHNYFTLSPKRWIEGVNAIGIVSKAGKHNGGTYAHKDIALQFASWISPEINLYIIKELQRLKAQEQKQLDWSFKRELTKINYRIHTDAIKSNIIVPHEISKEQATFVYTSEADVLNVALFGSTAKQWRDQKSQEERKHPRLCHYPAAYLPFQPREYKRLFDRMRNKPIGKAIGAKQSGDPPNENLGGG